MNKEENLKLSFSRIKRDIRILQICGIGIVLAIGILAYLTVGLPW
jgi:hypothetical protein